MKSALSTRMGAAIIATVLSSLIFPATGHAVLGLFKKEKKLATSESQASLREQAASEIYAQGISAEDAKKWDNARKHYAEVVDKFPDTDTAAEAQLKIAELWENEGKASKAFDAYQKFIDNYKQSARFEEVVRRQYELAMNEYRRDPNRILLFSKKLPYTRIVEMLGEIPKNAPYSDFAPEAIYTVGEIYEEEKMIDEAVASYGKVVEDYPKHPKAAEAQFQIGTLLTRSSRKSNNEQAQLQKTREAYEEFLIQFREHELVTEAKTQLNAIAAQEASKSFEIARFYERSGNPRAAVVYYRDVLKYPGAAEFVAAKDRIAALNQEGSAAALPDSPEKVSAESPEKKPRTEAAPSTAATPATPPVAASRSADGLVKNSAGYYGPPAPPDLSKVAGQPKMRTNTDDPVPIPMEIEEPDLPESTADDASGTASAAGKAKGEKEIEAPSLLTHGFSSPESPAASMAAGLPMPPPPPPPAAEPKETKKTGSESGSDSGTESESKSESADTETPEIKVSKTNDD